MQRIIQLRKRKEHILYIYIIEKNFINEKNRIWAIFVGKVDVI
jgi:hypothetical protein